MMMMVVVEVVQRSICQYGGESGVDDGGGVADDDGADGVDGEDNNLPSVVAATVGISPG